MRSFFRKWGLRFLRWGHGTEVKVIPVPKDELYSRAVVLTGFADELPDLPPHSGEYRRHWVYAKLLKEFPLVTRRDVAHAIEAALF